MKKLILQCMIYANIWCNINYAQCITPEALADAKEIFVRMSAREISETNITSLTPTQLAAFRQLSTELFHSEIASHTCSSQAKRAKAQIMYQKIAQLYQQ